MSQHAATPDKYIPSPRVRLYIYRCLVAAGPVVLLYGLLSAEEIAVWLGLGATVLSPGAGLAAANTPKGTS
jgi:hypothetical protein